MTGLVEKDVNLEDCIPYGGSLNRKGGRSNRRKSKWRKGRSPIFDIVKDSIKEVGLINPLWVIERDDGYLVIRGSCRAIACKRLGIKRVKVLIAPKGMSRKELRKLFLEADYKKIGGIDYVSQKI
jgi:hypothetical protein